MLAPYIPASRNMSFTQTTQLDNGVFKLFRFLLRVLSAVKHYQRHGEVSEMRSSMKLQKLKDVYLSTLQGSLEVSMM